MPACGRTADPAPYGRDAGVWASPGSRPCAAVTSPRPRFPVAVSLGGGHLLGDALFAAFVSDAA
jgi:hypothetical protein